MNFIYVEVYTTIWFKFERCEKQMVEVANSSRLLSEFNSAGIVFRRMC